MILTVAEMEEPGASGLTPEERVYRIENQLSTLVRIVQELALATLGANSHVLLESEGVDSARITREAKNNAREIGNLLQDLRELFPPSP